MPTRAPAPIGPGFGNPNSSRSVLDYINTIDELNKYGVDPEIYPKTGQEEIAGEVLLNYTPEQKSLMDYINYFARQGGIDPKSFSVKIEKLKSDDPNLFLSGAQDPKTHTIFLDSLFADTKPLSVWNAFHELQHEIDTQKKTDKPNTGQKLNTEEKFHHGEYEKPIQDIWPYLKRRQHREDLGFPNAPLNKNVGAAPALRGPASLQELMVQSRKRQLNQAPWVGRILPGSETEKKTDFDEWDQSTWSQRELDAYERGDDRDGQYIDGVPLQRQEEAGPDIWGLQPNETMVKEQGWDPGEPDVEEMSKWSPEVKKAYEKQRRVKSKSIFDYLINQ